MSKAIAKLNSLINRTDVKERLKQAFGDEKEAGLFIASLMETMNNNSLLQKCDPQDIIRESLKSAVLRLPISDALGYAYLVPFKQKDQYKPVFVIGYKGLIQLALRTGQYKVIHADVVYEGEKVKRDKITGEVKIIGEPKSNKAIGYIAHIELVNGFQKTIYMTKQEIIEHAKKYSKSFNSSYSPWKSNFDEMALKTVLRKILSVYGIKSIEYLMHDNEDFTTNTEPENIPETPAEIIEQETIEPTKKEEKDNAENIAGEEIPF